MSVCVCVSVSVFVSVSVSMSVCVCVCVCVCVEGGEKERKREREWGERWGSTCCFHEPKMAAITDELPIVKVAEPSARSSGARLHCIARSCVFCSRPSLRPILASVDVWCVVWCGRQRAKL